jgi:integrase
MGHSIEKLKAIALERLAKKPGLHGDGGGLYLRVTSATARSWVFRYMLAGKAREMGLGSYPEITLAQARTAATEARQIKAQGRDPVELRTAVRAQERADAARAVTFRQCAERYIAAREAAWRNSKHAAQWSATLETYVMPTVGDLPVQSVDVALVHRILDPIWSVKPETASRVRGRMEAILDWAATRGYRQGENPARWKGHLENLFPRRSKVRRVEHHAALPFAEISAFMTVLRSEEGLGALALQLTIMTAARTGEVIAAKWSEIDLEGETWTVPAERMKGGREHRVPLSKPALAILRERHKAAAGSEYVFPGAQKRKPLSNMAMLQTLRRMGRGDLTVHGFRSTFRDWAAERTTYPAEVAEAALAHVVGDKVEAAYRRGDLFDKRRKLMAAWAVFCTTHSAQPNVLTIRPSATSRAAAE